MIDISRHGADLMLELLPYQREFFRALNKRKARPAMTPKQAKAKLHERLGFVVVDEFFR